ncbi:putative Uncharacterized oxidoreductase ygbJ [Glarea lozoyensis 74030]|nr:putative Uncharacterized oxidoreductase ygbJ [Glarea lozoyensis 74030]
MVNQLLAGTHIAAAAEAMGLAATMGLNTQQVFDIITGAAGNSWMFENRVPHMLKNDWTRLSAVDIFVKDMGIVTSSARALEFPLPIASSAEQLFISASKQGYGRDDDSSVVRLYIPTSPAAVSENARPADKLSSSSKSWTANDIKKIGFVGLGAMGIGMAKTLTKAGYQVQGYDVYPPSVEKFVAASESATAATSPSEAASGAQALILMVQNAKQAHDVLFGSGKAAEALPHGSVVILNSTVPPSAAREIRERLVAVGKDLDLVDAPVSGGVARAASGQLTIMSSADELAISKANVVLSAMSGEPKNLHYIAGGAGAASSVKLINQLLAGVHIAAAAEAMAFGAKLGLDTRSLYNTIKNAAGGSWMFENRVPAMLDADWTPHSMLAIFVKDLGIVLDESKRLLYAAPLSSTAHTLYLQGASHGLSREADGGVVRVWEFLTGVSVAKSASARVEKKFVPREYQKLSVAETTNALPAPYEGNPLEMINSRISEPNTPILVVLDDDPTGTQTCHDISVLTVWSHDTLCQEFRATEKGFFILTNSRALPTSEARSLITTICQNVEKAAKETGKGFEIVLRGDSTLRGHFPDEPEVIEEVLGKTDGWILAPFFFQGGRYTIDDVHYVAEGDVLVPASQTPFAEDATFGYKSSNLRDYVFEKTGSKFKDEQILSITIEDIRLGGPEKVASKLINGPRGGVVIANAAAESDMYVFAAGVLSAAQQGRKYLYRTGAAFVSSRLGIRGISPLSAEDLKMDNSPNSAGGLIVAGSYVPKTTAQLASLRSRRGSKLHVIELDVSSMIQSKEQADAAISSATSTASSQITSGHDVLVMTSRKLITGHDANSSLSIGTLVAAALVKVVRNIEVRPRYVIAKGGITSSDAATKGLEIKRAMIVGQAAPGVPLWRCDEETSRHTGVPYVVFPGNVGGEDTLAELVERWAKPE